MKWSIAARYHWYRWSKRAINKYSLVGSYYHKAIFVHIPKTGGISVNRALFHSLGGGHSSLLEYRQRFGQEDFDSFYKFTIVRDPVDRLISAANFLYAGGQSLSDKSWLARQASVPSDVNQLVADYLPTLALEQVHFRPQTSFFEVDLPNFGFDFIARFENLEKDFQHICSHLGTTTHLSRSNTSAAASYLRRDLTEDSLRRIGDLYSKDFELLSYSIQP